MKAPGAKCKGIKSGKRRYFAVTGLKQAHVVIETKMITAVDKKTEHTT